MNKIFAFMLLCLCLSAGAQTEQLPSAPYIKKPSSAHWLQLPPADASKSKEEDGIVRAEYWLRGNDYKQETTYASGRVVTLLSIGGYGIYSDSQQKQGSISYLSSLNAGASEELKFANGYVNVFQVLNWVSRETFSRAGSVKGRPVFIYEKTLPPDRDGETPVSCVAAIDAETRFPVSCSFGGRVYAFDGLETNVAIPDSVFAMPAQVAPLWEEHQNELARQDRLRRINAGAQ